MIQPRSYNTTYVRPKQQCNAILVEVYVYRPLDFSTCTCIDNWRQKEKNAPRSSGSLFFIYR